MGQLFPTGQLKSSPGAEMAVFQGKLPILKYVHRPGAGGDRGMPVGDQQINRDSVQDGGPILPIVTDAVSYHWIATTVDRSGMAVYFMGGNQP